MPPGVLVKENFVHHSTKSYDLIFQDKNHPLNIILLQINQYKELKPNKAKQEISHQQQTVVLLKLSFVVNYILLLAKSE